MVNLLIFVLDGIKFQINYLKKMISKLCFYLQFTRILQLDPLLSYMLHMRPWEKYIDFRLTCLSTLQSISILHKIYMDLYVFLSLCAK